MAIETLVITGASTNGCAETNARDAADRGYNCFLVDDGCATKQGRLHEATMQNFELFCGKRVMTAEIIEQLSVLLKNKGGEGRIIRCPPLSRTLCLARALLFERYGLIGSINGESER